MFGNLIDGSQNTVWSLALEGKIVQNSENRSTCNNSTKVSMDCLLFFQVNSVNEIDAQFAKGFFNFRVIVDLRILFMFT